MHSVTRRDLDFTRLIPAEADGVRPNISWTDDMNHDARTTSRRYRMERLLPGLGFFAGGLVYSLLPRGAFGAHDVAARAAITGGTAAAVALVIFAISRRWKAS